MTVGISKLENPRKPYAWGSRTVIPRLLGEPVPAAEPVAELWMGAHGDDSSSLCVDGERQPLAEVIRRRPEEVLGARVVARYGPALPFLFKVLAVEGPLSIQAHPDREQARAGFEREERRGVGLGERIRCYRDRNHKPEVLCAWGGPFSLLRGFREAGEIVALFDRLALADRLPEVDRMRRDPGAGALRALFQTCLGLEGEAAPRLIDAAVAAAGEHEGEHEAFAWIVRLAECHRGDLGVLAPLFLRLLVLEPGQAVFTGPGVIHAYLEGTGIELMASSDNVLRGGLTPKHVDVGELLRIARFETVPPGVLEPERRSATERAYATPADDFALSELRVADGATHRSGERSGVEILLCVEGEGRLVESGGRTIAFRRGESYLVPAAVAEYLVEGEAGLYRAGVGL